jgi:HD-GYP domain-containing protein (c-di-GMP phosphodiesterase class II)
VYRDSPYREAKSAEEAMEELKNCSGAQFDPTVVAAFEVVLSEREDSHVNASTP